MPPIALPTEAELAAVLTNALASAWDAFLDNTDENETELSDLVEDYESETGISVIVARHHQFERNVELRDSAFKAWCQARVQQKCGDLVSLLLDSAREGSIIAWRALTAPADWTPSGSNCGIHWSFDRQGAEAHFADAGPGFVTHLVEGDVPLSSIDWYYTLRANLSEEFGDEHELRILAEAPVHVRHVTVECSMSP